MKAIRLTISILAFTVLLNLPGFSQSVGISDDGSTPDVSAMLDVKSNAGNKGFLMPRLTEVQKNAISTPATGLMIFQTDGATGFYYYSGSSWEQISNEQTTYATVANAESANGTDNKLCYVVENETYYRYESSASSNTDDNKYILSTNNGGDTRWLGVSGQYNLGSTMLRKLTHLDATSGSATITELNRLYFIEAAATLTTITIPDCNAGNEGWFVQISKESGLGTVRIVTTSGQLIGGALYQDIITTGQGLTLKSNTEGGGTWHKIQDSRSNAPVVINQTTDYGATETWIFNFLLANTTSNDITITFPADISGFNEGDIRMFFNTGTHIVYGDPNGNLIDGSTDIRMIAPGGYVEVQKINGYVKIIREKNVTLKKTVDEISNLEIWLDASTLSGTDGSLLATWTDLSGNSHNFTASNQPTLQTVEQNGKNVVRFDGVNDVMSAGDVEIHENTRGMTIIAVVKPTDTKRMAIMTKYMSTPDNREFEFGNVDNMLFENLTWGSMTGAVLTMSQNDFQIAEMVWTPGNPFELYINGTLQATANLAVNDVSDGIANLKIGCGDYTSVGYWKGDFAEIMAYSQAVSDTERELLRQNLAVKWDIDEIIIASGGEKYWKRDGNTNTISPDVDNDNLNIGTGTFTGNVTVSTLFNAPQSATAPASPQEGTIYFNTVDKKLKVWNGTTWNDLN
jgi:hypothetical protein